MRINCLCLIFALWFLCYKGSLCESQLPKEFTTFEILENSQRIQLERAIFLLSKYPIGSSDPGDSKFITYDSSAPQKTLWDVRFSSIILPQIGSFTSSKARSDLFVPSGSFSPPIFKDFSQEYSSFLHWLLLGPTTAANPWHALPKHINLCNYFFHSLTNLGINPETFYSPEAGKPQLSTLSKDFSSIGNSKYYFSNFSITAQCSDLQTVSKSEFLQFFCLYCPIQHFPDHIFFENQLDATKFSENRENWLLDLLRISESNFQEIDDKLKLGGVRNFFIKLNRQEDKENDKFLSFRFKFKNYSFLYCIPSPFKQYNIWNVISYISTYFVGERYFKCDDSPDNCFCESFFDISIFHHLNFLTSLSLSLSLPFLITLGCCCGFFPQILGCLFHPKHLCTNFKLYSFIFWFLGTTLSFCYNFGLFWFSFESYWEWFPFMINVFDPKDEALKKQFKIPDLEQKIASLFPIEYNFWPAVWRYDAIKFIFSIIPFANYLTWFCTFFSFVSLVFHLFFLTSLFEQYTKANRLSRRLIVQILLISFLGFFVTVNGSCFLLRILMEVFIFFEATENWVYSVLEWVFHFIFDCGGVFLVTLLLVILVALAFPITKDLWFMTDKLAKKGNIVAVKMLKPSRQKVTVILMVFSFLACFLENVSIATHYFFGVVIFWQPLLEVIGWVVFYFTFTFALVSVESAPDIYRGCYYKCYYKYSYLLENAKNKIFGKKRGSAGYYDQNMNKSNVRSEPNENYNEEDYAYRSLVLAFHKEISVNDEEPDPDPISE